MAHGIDTVDGDAEQLGDVLGVHACHEAKDVFRVERGELARGRGEQPVHLLDFKPVEPDEVAFLVLLLEQP